MKPTTVLVHGAFAESSSWVPAELQRFTAERARARRTLVIPGASHGLSVSQPQAAVGLILEVTAVPAAV